MIDQWLSRRGACRQPEALMLKAPSSFLQFDLIPAGMIPSAQCPSPADQQPTLGRRRATGSHHRTRLTIFHPPLPLAPFGKDRRTQRPFKPQFRTVWHRIMKTKSRYTTDTDRTLNHSEVWSTPQRTKATILISPPCL
jgi:hypothetical protein